MPDSGRNANDDSAVVKLAALQRLLARFGLGTLSADIYGVLLVEGPSSPHRLASALRTDSDAVEQAMRPLQHAGVVGVGYRRFKPRYHLRPPHLAWMALSTELLWGSTDKVWTSDERPVAHDRDVENKRQLCAEIADTAGSLYREHLATAGHQEWDATSDDEFAQYLCEVVGQARRTIVAVSKSPRLPQVAAFWTTLTNRMDRGVTYRRVADLEEIIAHGLEIVDRDMNERQIDLRVLERGRIRNKFYAVDEKFVGIFHASKDASGTSRRGVGRFTNHERIVRRYSDRFQEYHRDGIPGRFVVEHLRACADAMITRAAEHLGNEGGRWVAALIRKGKFSRFHKEIEWSQPKHAQMVEQAKALGLIRRNVEGEVVAVYPTTESLIRSAYTEVQRKEATDGQA